MSLFISSPFSIFVLLPPEAFAMNLHFEDEHDDELHFEEEGGPFFYLLWLLILVFCFVFQLE